jgi:hypothetical protein
VRCEKPWDPQRDVSSWAQLDIATETASETGGMALHGGEKLTDGEGPSGMI